jgi:hypothetical protein
LGYLSAVGTGRRLHLILNRSTYQSQDTTKLSGGFYMIARIVANEDGSMVIPSEIAVSIGIAPEKEYLVYQRDEKILMISRDRLLSLLDNMTDAMIEQMEEVCGFSEKSPL